VVLGNVFTTDIALIRFQMSGSVLLPPGSTVAKIVLTTVAEALASAAAKIQDLEETDIGAEFRVAMTSGGRSGEQVEVYLYDLTPGGAGFVRSAVSDAEQLFTKALERLESCNCTHSCYECLRSYKNKWDHKYLHRRLASAFIRHIVLGQVPTIVPDDDRRLLRALAVDLVESGHEVEEAEGGLRLPGLNERVIVLGHPLTPGEPGSDAGRVLSASEEQVVVVDQLLVDFALPAAVRKVTGQLTTENTGPLLPSFLPPVELGYPVYEAASLSYGAFPEPVATVGVPGAPEGSFVLQLDCPTLERMPPGAFSAGAWVVFVPTEENDFVVERDRVPRLLLSRTGAFNATGKRWTFGLPSVRQDKIHILYYSHVAPRAETPRASDVAVLGRAYGVFVDGVLQLVGGP
jgi:hypothetical protein